MRKKVLTLLLIFCLLVILSLNNKISVKASPKIWTVSGDPGRPADFTTIQEAINSPVVDEGDTIFVYNWIYRENIVVNKSISLRGENRDSTIIDGGNKDNVIYINVPKVNINGFTIQQSGFSPKSGIFLDHSVNSNISYNKIINCGDGLSLYYSSNNIISNNIIRFGNIAGIRLFGSANNILLGNTVLEGYYGVLLQYSDANMISKNLLLYNFYEIYLFSSSRNMISRNTISFCLTNGVGIYVTFYSANNIVFNNNFFNNTKNVQIEGDLSNFWDYNEKGNYWSEYTGQDINGDGIGETPYKINQYNQDNYPLMGIFFEFNVYYTKVYTVDVISNSTIFDFKFEVGNETGNKILSFSNIGKDGSKGFCRIEIPRDLMEYPHIVLVDSFEVASKILALNETYVCLYFHFSQNSKVTIISSRTASLYYELLDKYLALNQSFYNLNASFYIVLNEFLELQSNFTALNKKYYLLVSNYTQLVGEYESLCKNYTKLQKGLEILNDVYSVIQHNYTLLLGNYSQLQKNFEKLQSSLQTFSAFNDTYHNLLNSYNLLQENFNALNRSYVDHLSEYSNQTQNTRNLTYIFIAMTAIFIAVVVYLSKRAHSTATVKTRFFEEKEERQS